MRETANRPDTVQYIWTLRTAVELDELLILIAANRNPAIDAALRSELIAASNDRNFSWAHADEAGVWHMQDGDRLCPEIERTGLFTWQEIWDRIGPNITDANVAELHAAIANGAETRHGQGIHRDMRLHSAKCAFYKPASAALSAKPVQLDLFALVATKVGA